MSEEREPYKTNPDAPSPKLYEAYMQVAYIMTGEGYRPGSFSKLIIEALMHADPNNFAKLRTIYPELAQAVEDHRAGRVKIGVDYAKEEKTPEHPFTDDD